MEKMILPDIVSAGVYHTRHYVKAGEMTPERRTAMFDLELSAEEGGISYIGCESHPISKRLFVCARPGELRHTRSPYHCYYVHFVLKEGPLYDALMGCPHYTELSEQSYAEYKRIFEGLCRYDDKGTVRDRVMQQSLLLHLLSLALGIEEEGTPCRRRGGNNGQAVRRALDYIHTHLAADLSLSALAAAVSFSPIHFHNCFRAVTGRTLRDYVEEQRIKHAVDLLVRTELTLAEIAYECGFSSQSYFSYAFKRRMGSTPREYAAALLSHYGREETGNQ